MCARASTTSPHLFLFASCNLSASRPVHEHVIQAESEGQHPAHFLFHRYRRVWLGAPRDPSTRNGFRLVLLRRVGARGVGPSHSCCSAWLPNPKLRIRSGLLADAGLVMAWLRSRFLPLFVHLQRRLLLRLLWTPACWMQSKLFYPPKRF
jgi:hypothetical protein